MNSYKINILGYHLLTLDEKAPECRANRCAIALLGQGINAGVYTNQLWGYNGAGTMAR
jgi:hypothetical protein